MQGKNKGDPGIITLWIDNYSEIFSDFDPRPFSERAISDDFVTHIRRVSRENTSPVSILRLLIPEGTQNEDHERVIKKRLQSYFANICEQLRTEFKNTRSKGILFFVIGVSLMTIASYISSLNYSGFPVQMLLTLFEPGGWFFFWAGLDLLTSALGKKKSESQFFSRMENINVDFGSYK